MKKIYWNLLLLIAAVLWTGCNSEPEYYVLDTVEDGMHLSASKDTVTLFQDELDLPAVTFNWKPAQQRKNNGAITYYFKIGLASDEMVTSIDKVELTEDLYQQVNGAYQYSILTWELNEIINKSLGIGYGNTVELMVAVIADSEGGSYYVKPEVSKTTVIVNSFQVTPTNLYLVGTANPNGEEQADGIKLTEVIEGRNFGNAYQWEGNLQAGTFKFVNSLSVDEGGWSMGSDPTLLVKNASISETDVEFAVTKPGWYSIVLNKEEGKITYGYKGFKDVWGVGLGIGIAWTMPSQAKFNWSAEQPNIFWLECQTQANQDFKLPYNDQSRGWSAPFLRPMIANGNIELDNRVQATPAGFTPDLKWLITPEQAGKCLLTIDTEKMTIRLDKFD